MRPSPNPRDDSRRIDLHVHSTASDGTTSPAVVVGQAKDAQLDVMAITDHDTTAGWVPAAEAALAAGIGLVRGAEISATEEGMTVHLLAYLFDPTYEPLVAELAKVREDRVSRARRMVERIGADYAITWQDVLAHTSDGATVGRPHIADALVGLGIVPSRDVAFTSVLAGGSPYYVPHYSISGEHAVRLVREAGGVPVIAHPGASMRGKTLSDAGIARLVGAGVAGLEVYHRDHSAQERERLLALSATHDLIVTGSSDFHGTGKLNQLGENLTSPAMFERIVEQASGVEVL